MNKILLSNLAILGASPLMGQQKPNVVFILADDLGYADLGCYGQTKIKTPNLDKMAAQGIRFSDFYAGTSVSAPSRSSLMTGFHTGHTPIRGNYEIKPEGQAPIPDSALTLAELFKSAGYATGAFGKWGLGYPGSQGAPERQGFDQFYGYNCQRQSHNYFPDHLWRNSKKIPLKNALRQQREYAPELIQHQALDFIAKNSKKPFFLYLSYTLPHAGLQLPARDALAEYYKKRFNEAPRLNQTLWNGEGYQPQAYPRATYAAMVSRLDEYIGQVLAKLKEQKLDKNTLIIFTSDNGPHREGGNDPEFFNSSGPYKGIKRSLYEGGIRVPMIAYWKGRIPAGQQSSHPAAFWDFMPTFSALVKNKKSVPTDGISLLPVLTGKGSQPQHAFLYWEFHEDGGRQAVRMGKWKGVKEKVSVDPNAKWELYDLSTDAGETTDLAGQYPAIVSKIAALAKSQHRPSPIKEWLF